MILRLPLGAGWPDLPLGLGAAVVRGRARGVVALAAAIALVLQVFLAGLAPCAGTMAPQPEPARAAGALALLLQAPICSVQGHAQASHPAPQAGKGEQGPGQPQHSAMCCGLCVHCGPSAAAIAAGLIGLPPPSLFFSPSSHHTAISQVAEHRFAAFAARAPPAHPA